MEMNRPPFGWRQRSLIAINVGAMCLVLAGIVVGLNILARRYKKRFDVTASARHSLEEGSRKVLAGLRRDVTIYVTHPAHLQQRWVPYAWEMLLDTLTEMREASRQKLVWHIVQENDKDHIRELSRHFTTFGMGTIYFIVPGTGDKPITRTRSFEEIAAGDFSEGHVTRFEAEGKIVSTLRQMVQEEQRILYYTTGHQEMPLVDLQQPCFATVERFLRENDNVELRPLDLVSMGSVPEDASCVAVLGPRTPFTPAQSEVLNQYLKRGGKVFVGLEPEGDPQLDGFLSEWGVTLRRCLVLDPDRYAKPYPWFLVIQAFPPHPANEGMGNTYVTLPQATLVRPMEKPPEGITMRPLMLTGARAWGDRDALKPNFTGTPRPDPEEEAGVLPVAVALEKAPKTRMIVWGSAKAISTLNTGTPMNPNFHVIDYVLNNFRWLLETEEAIVKPKESTLRPLTLQPADRTKIFWVSIAGLPLLGVVLGLVAWTMRRK